LEFALLLQTSLQWPYNTLYNCYWAGYELYTPIDEQEQPVLTFALETEKETKTLNFWEQLIQNILFNAGYQILDVVWYV